MIFAQILNTIIVNVIELDDASLALLFVEGYDACVRIDNLDPIPVIGSTQNYDGTFNSPLNYYEDLVSQAMDFGNQLIVRFAAANVALGITQAGMTLKVLNYAAALNTSLSTGSLYVAMEQIMAMIADTSSTKNGAYATAIDAIDSPNITFTANTLGIIGNSITLVFDGISTISTIVETWNTNNLSNQVSYTGLSSVIPTAQTISLSGGITTLAPFVNNDVLYSYLNQIEEWLEIPLTSNPGS